MPLPKPASPRVLIADIRAVWQQRPRHQWMVLSLAILIPLIIVGSFFLDTKMNVAPRERIIYVDSWPATRTDAEIRADQRARAAERRAAEQERQREFRRVDEQLNRLGI